MMKNNTSLKMYLIIILMLLIMCFLSINIGPSGLSNSFDLLSDHNTNILRYRLIRFILASIAGASLALSGASLQAIFRNPLADPHIFGVSGGASLGACLVIAFAPKSWFFFPKFGAIFGGAIAFLLIFYVLKRTQNTQLNNCLIIGILINSVASSIITILKIMLSSQKTQNILFWLVGNLSSVENFDFLFIIPLWLLGSFLLLNIRNELEILAFGQEEATILGLNFQKIAQVVILANCLLIGNVVSFAGMIGFVGLVIPHLARRIFWPKFSSLMPLSMLCGALVLSFFDAIGRLSFWWFSTEIPVGALCALFLSPLFFMLIIKGNNNEQSYY